MEETRFKKGDCVKLRDNIHSPIMFITHIEVDKLRNKSVEIIDGVEQAARPIHCFWFDKNEVPRIFKFDKRELVITKPVERKLWFNKGILNYATSELDDMYNTEPIEHKNIVYSQGFTNMADEEYKY